MDNDENNLSNQEENVFQTDTVFQTVDDEEKQTSGMCKYQ